MRLESLALSCLAVAMAQQGVPCQTGPAYQASLVVTTSFAVTGAMCEPFQCSPNQNLVQPGKTMRFDIGGVSAQPFMLVCGSPLPNCLPFPGVVGELGLWDPMAVVFAGTIGNEGPNSNCHSSGTTVRQLAVPAALPSDLVVTFQVVAMNVGYEGEEPVVALSRPTDVYTVTTG